MRVIVFLCLLVAVHSCTMEQNDMLIRKAVDNQLHSYPESTLRDVYKNFFQDRFGPGHIVNDTTQVGMYLREELSSTKVFHGKYYEPTGYQGKFYRVNLSVIKEGLVGYHTYFDAFIRSVNGIVPPSIEDWKKEWKHINHIISEMNIELNNYIQDSIEIDNLLKQDKYVISHKWEYHKNSTINI